MILDGIYIKNEDAIERFRQDCECEQCTASCDGKANSEFIEYCKGYKGACDDLKREIEEIFESYDYVLL